MAHKSNLRTCLRISMFFLAAAGFAQARTITVGPGAGYNFDTIQAGIDSANDADTVLVAPGEYVITVPITFRGKAITVQSEAGPDETTIRMGTPADPKRGSVVIFENNETAASVLDGFTITGGIGFPLRDVPLRGFLRFHDSGFEWCGGGICFVFASSGTVRNCAIVQNTADNGGGVWAHSGSSATLTNCIISGNSARHGAGGGVGAWYGSLTLTRCAILSNTVQYLGTGVYAGNSSATLTNCVIARNTGASWGGGGVMCSEPAASVTINNCTIWGNSAGGDEWGGGGVLCRVGSTKVTNSIVWANTSPKGSEISLNVGGELSITYSNVAGGQARVNVESGGTLNWGAGNINADPCFADLGYWADINDPNVVVEPDDPNAVWIDGDYHLKSEAGRWDPYSDSWVLDDATSPSIDRGDPNSPVGDEPDPNGGIINMGAYGGTPEASMSIGQLPPLPPPPPLAYWKLDEAEGSIAHDSVFYNDGTLHGDPLWQPTGGAVDGALQFDGIDDYVSTPYVLNPTDGAFSVFAWIKGGAPGQAIISQADRTFFNTTYPGSKWLSTDPAEGKLMTELQGTGRDAAALMSNFVITDGQWHWVGFVWDGSQRMLYVNDVEVATDTQGSLEGSAEGLYIGAGNALEPGSFFSGLIDDVRIYNRAVTP